MADDSLTISNIRKLLRKRSTSAARAFEILQAITVRVSLRPEGRVTRELVLRALNRARQLQRYAPMLIAAAREVGLFPYLPQPKLGVADQIAYEFHRPENMPKAVVFHSAQARVYRRLLSGANVILSAPTSFGKSLIIDAIVASQRYKNIAVVVPTIALIDETRKRLSRFRDEFRVITHVGQATGDRNIFVFTQERVLQFPDLPKVDFFVIDEFYKLSPDTASGDDRAFLLNQAFYKLLKQGGQFYMLGPSVRELSPGFTERLKYEFMHEPFETVVSDVVQVESSKDELQALVTLCARISGPTVIFCSSPDRARTIAEKLRSSGIYQPSKRVSVAADWIGRHYHPDWHAVKALEAGIGVHHARIPRALGQHIVRCFNEGELNVLICTSTLIEGVNTRARNMIVLDHKLNRQPIDRFTFNNIRGRAGRMFQHFIGHVYIFNAEPQGELPFVDLPVFSQTAGTPSSLLLQLDDEDLTKASRARLLPLEAQKLLDLGTLRENVGVEPEEQLEFARELYSRPGYYQLVLNWNGIPNTAQLNAVCKIMWDRFNGRVLGAGSTRLPQQLPAFLRKLGTKSAFSGVIRDLAQHYTSGDADQATTRWNDFVRLWAQFHFPRLLGTIDRIQRDVFRKLNMPAGNYTAYTAMVENLFDDPALIALDEYGIPLQLAKKLRKFLATKGDFDEALRRLRTLDVNTLPLDAFERDVLEDAIKYA